MSSRSAEPLDTNGRGLTGLAIAELVTAVALPVTIVGIPLAAGNVKLVPISLLPFRRTVIPVDRARATVAAFL